MATKRKVLFLEDDAAHEELIGRAFASFMDRYELKFADTVESARAIMAEEHPDLVVADWRLPDGYGLDVLRAEASADIAVVLMTAYGDEDVAVEAIKAGALDYIVKCEKAFAEMPHVVDRAFREWDHIQGRRRAERRAREKDARIQSMLRAAPVGIGMIRERVFVEVNEHLCEMLGYAREELLGQDAQMIYPNREDYAYVGEEKYRQIREHGVGTVQTRWQCKDGRILEILLRSARINHEDPTAGTTFTALDVTDSNRAERELAESQRRLSTLMSNLPGMAYRCRNTLQWPMIFVSEGVEALTGYQSEEICGGSPEFVELIDEDDRPRIVDTVREALRTGRSFEIEYCIRTKGGQLKWVWERGVAVEDTGGEILEGFITDITERKQVEEALRESEKRFKGLAELLPQPVWETDADGNFTYANQAGYEIFGYSEKDLKEGRTVEDVIVPEDHRKVRDNFEAVLNEGVVDYSRGSRAYTCITKDGRRFPAIIYSSPIIRDGKPVGVRGITLDITEHKRTEEALSASEQKYRTYVDYAPIAIFIADEGGRYVDVNEAACRMLGYTRDELLNMSIKELDVSEGGANAAEHFAELQAAGYLRSDRRLRSRDGTAVDVDLEAVALDGSLYMAFCSDISERKRARAELERLTSAIEQSAEIIIITDPEGVIEYVNPAFQRITGYSRQEVLGRNPKLLKSGQQDEMFYRDLWRTIMDGRIWEGQIVNRKKDGALYTEEASISPVRDPSGEIVHFVAVKRDVTEHLKLQQETQRLQAQYQQAQKLESVGRLAGGVAHDLNNMLSPILGYSEMLQRELTSGDPRRKSLEEIWKAGNRARDLVRRLLAFARKQTIELQPVDLNRVVTDFSRLLRRTIREDIKIQTHKADTLKPVLADVGQIEQVIMNLVVNAQDAMPKGGTLTIATSEAELDEGYCEQHPGSRPGRYCVLNISDTGTGMDPEIQDQIFEPFFSTKGEQGTGLGLASVYGIVKQHNGSIWCYSEPGRGTTFKVYLPMIEAATEPGTSTREASVEIPKGSGTILLVEDSEMVRRLTHDMLEAHGYRIIAAHNGREGLSLLEDMNREIDLILTDVIMPDMGGREMFMQASAKYPDLKVIYMSGYTGDVVGPEGQLSEKEEFIQKPFSMHQMLQKVHNLLHRS